MPEFSTFMWNIITGLYSENKLSVSSAQVTIDSIAISASATILGVSTNTGPGYEDVIIDFRVTFNTNNAGTLQQIIITVNAFPASIPPVSLMFCSSENQPVPVGTVQVTKRHIIRFYKS